ncbi:MAG: PhzF family phenazine biosynthesis protein [Candidatus Zixiibacteriota bacterium]|nr:MAG: PhzF family phenazine biosynthesis protein [candidate division Zixibacteria bacterium]
MPRKLYHVDSFTGVPFAGNPAGVCIMGAAAPEDWMQNIAAEMNLSETAFLYPAEDGFNLRWFTPTVEVDLCGHATLASAHILRETGLVDPAATIIFHTKGGLLKAEDERGWIRLDFPALPPYPVKSPPTLVKALGAPAVFVGANETSYLVELESEQAVKTLKPDIALLAGFRVIVTARSGDEKYDFVSRYFAPAIGIDEDPVTGSAHCCLGPYWMQRLQKTELMAYQASRRGGEVKVLVRGDRVHLMGRAVTVFEMQIC